MIVGALLVRQMLVRGLPIIVRNSTCDDRLMIRMAEGLLGGNWLGDYNGLTLMKGSFFPMFLAAVHAAGIPYLAAVTALHSAACLFFVSQLRFLLKGRMSRFLLFLFLLFEPASFDGYTFQAVYRNSITIPQVLLITGSLSGLWLDYGKHRWKDWIRAILAGFGIWSFWNTREDAVWILPFVLLGTLLAFGKETAAFRKSRSFRSLITGVLICVFPFCVLLTGNERIRRENRIHYGLPVQLECADGAFAGSLRTIYSVKNREEIPCVTVSQEKLLRLYEASPALAGIRKELDESNAFYSKAGRNRHSGEVEDGWFFWGLRQAAYTAGKAGSLPEAENYYRQIEQEIRNAAAAGELEMQKTMPSALMSPWRQGYGKKMAETGVRTLSSLLFFKDAAALKQNDRQLSPDILAEFEEISGERAVIPEDESSGSAKRAAAAADRMNRIGWLYQVLNPLFGILAAVLFPVSLLFSLIRKRGEHLPFFLTVAGMGFSILVMTAGIAYTDISAFPAVRCTYLAGAYPLMVSCIWLTLLYGSHIFLRGRILLLFHRRLRMTGGAVRR